MTLDRQKQYDMGYKKEEEQSPLRNCDDMRKNAITKNEFSFTFHLEHNSAPPGVGRGSIAV